MGADIQWSHEGEWDCEEMRLRTEPSATPIFKSEDTDLTKEPVQAWWGLQKGSPESGIPDIKRNFVKKREMGLVKYCKNSKYQWSWNTSAGFSDLKILCSSPKVPSRNMREGVVPVALKEWWGQYRHTSYDTGPHPEKTQILHSSFGGRREKWRSKMLWLREILLI